ncbi:hypothetical protein COO60DRAFT_147776 [Scenedesmus sp. NREL 46B-D3]|nr:hypothetical protein COO60DRAFT_147776 [Scenedesmus sp. NREL 46B-D3]
MSQCQRQPVLSRNCTGSNGQHQHQHENANAASPAGSCVLFDACCCCCCCCCCWIACRCPHPAACNPNTAAMTVCEANQSCRQQATFRELQCSTDYTGNLCGVCAEGFATVKLLTCSRCMAHGTLVALYATAVVVLLMFMKLLVALTLAANKLVRWCRLLTWAPTVSQECCYVRYFCIHNTS